MKSDDQNSLCAAPNEKSESSIDRRLARLRARLPAILERPCNRDVELNLFARWATWFAANSRGKCRRRGIPHAITREDIERLFIEQKYCCAVTGIPLDEPVPGRGRGQALPFGPSVDRIIPNLGYVPGNVRVTCLIVNLAMNKWSETVLHELMRRWKL